MDDVPVNYIVLAIPVFFLLIPLELVITRLGEGLPLTCGSRRAPCRRRV